MLYPLSCPAPLNEYLRLPAKVRGRGSLGSPCQLARSPSLDAQPMGPELGMRGALVLLASFGPDTHSEETFPTAGCWGVLPVMWKLPATCLVPSLWRDRLVLLRGGRHSFCLTVEKMMVWRWYYYRVRKYRKGLLSTQLGWGGWGQSATIVESLRWEVGGEGPVKYYVCFLTLEACLLLGPSSSVSLLC